MAKAPKKAYVCNDCGADFPRWQGQCNMCHAWNTVSEVNLARTPAASTRTSAPNSRGGYAGIAGGGAKKLEDVESHEARKMLTKIGELDRVLDDGVTLGSVVIISGDPGAGKTTLLSQLSCNMSHIMPSMYVSAEESLSQFKNRATGRLKLKFNSENFRLLSESSVEAIIEEADRNKVKFMVIDSIQTMVMDGITGQPGSISQVKACAGELNRYCKQNGVTLFLVCHVNKNKDAAGPKTLEHIGDATLHIDTNEGLIRTLRAKKNRFGDVDNVGLFQMNETGMISVDNPSKLFLSGSSRDSSGSVITCIRDGNRNLLLELQCLATDTEAEYPQRVCIGVNMNRLKMLSAVLKKHGGIKIWHDVYFNLVGGLKVGESETSTDLAMIAALLSSLNDHIIPRSWVFMGEVSLNGDIRPINSGVPRVKEAAKHGFEKIFIPDANYHKSMEETGASIIRLKSVGDLLEHIS